MFCQDSLPNRGFTVSVKDNIVTSSLTTSAASDVLRGFVAPEDAQVVKLLKEAGMVVVGKTNMDEFGMGSHSTFSAFGPVKNGIGHSALSVGGSSGGAAYSVAANFCHCAIGTDTGGSVRLPAAYLGLVGFKPSYGRISRNGVIPYANSLDTVGLLGRTCLDVWFLYLALDHPDPKDPTCLSPSSRERISQVKLQRRRAESDHVVRMMARGLRNEASPKDREAAWRTKEGHAQKVAHFPSKRRRVGVPTEYNIAELLPEVRDAWNRTLTILQDQGHEIVPVSLPSTPQALSAYYVLAPAEASSNLAKYDGIRYGATRQDLSDTEEDVLYSEHRGRLFGDEVKRRILLGSYTLSAGAMDNYFIQAQKVRRLVQQDFNNVFKMPHPLMDGGEIERNGVDLIVCPTAPTFPPSFDSLQQASPLESYVNDVFTVPASLAGLPAISVPAPIHPDSMKTVPQKAVGMQVIGQYGDDVGVIQFAKIYLEYRGGDTSISQLVPKHR